MPSPESASTKSFSNAIAEIKDLKNRLERENAYLKDSGADQTTAGDRGRVAALSERAG